MDQSGCRLLQANSHLLPRETRAEGCYPPVKRLGATLDDSTLDFASATWLQANVDSLIGFIQPDEGCEGCLVALIPRSFLVCILS
jgi:hypothetical protein